MQRVCRVDAPTYDKRYVQHYRLLTQHTRATTTHRQQPQAARTGLVSHSCFRAAPTAQSLCLAMVSTTFAHSSLGAHSPRAVTSREVSQRVTSTSPERRSISTRPSSRDAGGARREPAGRHANPKSMGLIRLASSRASPRRQVCRSSDRSPGTNAAPWDTGLPCLECGTS